MATAGLGGQIWSRPVSSEILAKIFDGVHACPRLDSIRVPTVFGDRWQRKICACCSPRPFKQGGLLVPMETHFAKLLSLNSPLVLQ